MTKIRGKHVSSGINSPKGFLCGRAILSHRKTHGRGIENSDFSIPFAYTAPVMGETKGLLKISRIYNFQICRQFAVI